MSKKHKVHFSTGKDDWRTPPEFFAKLHAEFDFELDPCCSENNLGLRAFITRKKNGLKTDWMCLNAFVNPPYSQLKQWVAKCAEESRKGSLVVMLIPARTDTKTFHEHIYDVNTWQPRPRVEIRFIKGRIKFVGATSGAPFPSMVVIFKPS